MSYDKPPSISQGGVMLGINEISWSAIATTQTASLTEDEVFVLKNLLDEFDFQFVREIPVSGDMAALDIAHSVELRITSSDGSFDEDDLLMVTQAFRTRNKARGLTSFFCGERLLWPGRKERMLLAAEAQPHENATDADLDAMLQSLSDADRKVLRASMADVRKILDGGSTH
jgi:hypothetical protein